MKNVDFRLFVNTVLEGRGVKNKLLIAFYLGARVLGYLLLNRKVFSELPYPVTVKNDDGIYYCGNSFSNLWAVNFRSELSIRKFFEPCRVFVDVGAHIGKYTVMMARKCRKVISIEPSPANFELLRQNVKLNKLRNVRAFNYACFSRDGKKRLYISSLSGMNSFHSRWAGSRKSILVQARKLDDVVRRADLVKIDVEGAEYDVLKGMKGLMSRSKPRIIVEVWESGGVARIRRLLQAEHYDLRKIEDHYYFCSPTQQK